MSDPAKEVKRDSVTIDGLEEVFDTTVAESNEQSVQTESTPLANREQEGLTLSEAASAFGVSKHTVRRWIKEGKVEAYKVNGERGPEWRVYGDHPDQNVDVDLTDKTNTFQSNLTQQVQPQQNATTELLMEQMELIREMRHEMEGLTYRNGYLQAQLEHKDEQLKLLPDFEALKQNSLKEIENKEEETKLINKELESVQKAYAELEEAHLVVKDELEAYKETEKKSVKEKLFGWFLGRKNSG